MIYCLGGRRYGCILIRNTTYSGKCFYSYWLILASLLVVIFFCCSWQTDIRLLVLAAHCHRRVVEKGELFVYNNLRFDID